MEDEYCRVFVGNLAWDVTDELFQEFASSLNLEGLVKIEVKRYEDSKRSKGWGLLYFSNSELAARSVTVLQSKQLNGRLLHTRLDKSQALQDKTSHNIFIGNIPWDKTDEDLMAIFHEFSPVTCNVLTNMYGKSRGFCLMQFKTEKLAIEAVEKMNKFMVGGRPIECRQDRGPGKTDDMLEKKSLFVGKLQPDITDQRLVDIFSRFGDVEMAQIQRSTDGISKGWGIVKFIESSDASNAIMTLNKTPFIQSNGKVMDVRYDRK